MTAWNGSGHRPAGLTLTDDEVLVLVRAGTIWLDPESPEFVPAVTAWRTLQVRAEDILNEQRASRR